jgi:hypothetical protein
MVVLNPGTEVFPKVGATSVPEWGPSYAAKLCSGVFLKKTGFTACQSPGTLLKKLFLEFFFGQENLVHFKILPDFFTLFFLNWIKKIRK